MIIILTERAFERSKALSFLKGLNRRNSVYSPMITSLCLVMLLALPDSLLTVVIDSDAGPFRHAVSVARAADGTFIVADHGENSVSVWNGRNERIRSIGGTG